jgi:Na+/melibiose symporter-like transporter
MPGDPARLPARTKLAYGVGQIAESIKTRGFDVLVFFYFTQVLGLSGSLAGTAIFVALLFDAVTDPMAGYLSDHWRSPRGRRHPFMYAAAIPLAVSWLLLFLPPDGLSQGGLFAWMLAFAVLVRGSMTLYHVPHLALGAELSTDYHERTSVVAWRTNCALVGAGVVLIAGIRIFLPETPEYENGMLDPSGYPGIALFTALIMLASVWYSAWGTRDRIPHLPGPTDGEKGNPLRDFASVLKNPSFLSLFVGFSVFAVSSGITSVLGTHVNVFFWEFDTDRISYLLIPWLFGFVPGVVLARPLHQRFDKKPTIVTAAIASAVAGNAAIALRLIGHFPENGTALLFWTVFALLFVVAVLAGIAFTTAGSMMADVAQEHEFVTGRSQQGVLFSAISLSSKAASGFGHLIAGWGLDWIRFPLQSAPSEVAPELVRHLGMVSLSASVIGAFSVVAYLFYHLDHARHLETSAALADRVTAGGPTSTVGEEARPGTEPGVRGIPDTGAS